MKKQVRDLWDWLADAGAWILLTLAATAGIIGAGFVLSSRRLLEFDRMQMIAQEVIAIGMATVLVHHDYKHGDRAVKRKRILPRIFRAFSMGVTSVILPAATWELVLKAVQLIVK